MHPWPFLIVTYFSDLDQRQITSALQASIESPVRNSGTEETGAESRSDSEEDDYFTEGSSDEDYETIDSDSDADNSDNNNYSSGMDPLGGVDPLAGMDPLAGLQTCAEYQTLLKDNFPSDVVLASLIKCGHTRNLDELTEWCFAHHTDQEIQDILGNYRQEHGGPRNSVPAPEQAVKVLPQPSQRMENRVIAPTSGGALLSQQFASVWDKFLTEVESVDGEADHISFLVLAKGLEALAAQVEPLNRAFFSQFTIGCPYLVRIMMAVWNLLEGHFQ